MREFNITCIYTDFFDRLRRSHRVMLLQVEVAVRYVECMLHLLYSVLHNAVAVVFPDSYSNLQ